MPRKATSQPTTKSDSSETSYDIITAQGWDVTAHNCGAAKANKSGQGKSASLTYNGRRFYIKTPKMNCPFGASKPKLKAGETPKENEQYSVQMAFNNDANDADSQTFQQKATEFDQFMIDEGAKPDNCVGWLGASKLKPFSREVVESKYSPMVKYSKKDGEIQTQYPPFIRASFPTTFKAPFEFTCEIYDKSNQLLTVSSNPNSPDFIGKVIPPFCQCSALLSGSIWSNNTTGFGVTWKVAQLKVFPPKGSIPKGKCLVSDPEDDEDDEEDDVDAKKEDVKDEAKEDVKDEGDEEIIEEDTTVEVETETPAVVESAPAKKTILPKVTK
jgi:hypothetical protein